MEVTISSLLRPFFADDGISASVDTKNPDHTFLTSGFRWGTKEAEEKAKSELKEFAGWVEIGLSEKGNPRTMMSLPFPLAEVQDFCDRQAMIYQNVREQPALDSGDVAAVVILQDDETVRVDIERSVAAYKAKPILRSKYWTKDDDYVSFTLPKMPSSLSRRPVLVYVRLVDDIITGVYDRARDEVILYGMHPADLAA